MILLRKTIYSRYDFLAMPLFLLKIVRLYKKKCVDTDRAVI